MRALVVGAAGRFGGLVIPELRRRGVSVRGLIRDRRGAEDEARRRGADQVVVADLLDPETLDVALDRVDRVFHLNPAFAPAEAEMGVNMVRAAQAAGVEKFVFSGAYHPTISAMVNHAAKQPVEEALYTSGLDFTVLQPAMFMQNLAGPWREALQSAKLLMPYSSRARVSYVDFRDVAEVAALALTGDELSYGVFELAAAGMVDRFQIAEMMARASGREIEAGAISPENLKASARFPDPLREGLARMSAHYDEFGFPGGNALVLRAILGREPRTLEQFIDELAAGPGSATERAST